MSRLIRWRSPRYHRLIRKFSINVDRDKNLIENEFGLFTDATDSERDNATAAYPRSDFYEYDVDNDGDGRADSIWVDIGLPMIELTDGRQVVPLVAYKVTDADALFNVNAHGNLTGLYFNSDTTTQTGFIDTNASGTQDRANCPCRSTAPTWARAGRNQFQLRHVR